MSPAYAFELALQVRHALQTPYGQSPILTRIRLFLNTISRFPRSGARAALNLLLIRHGQTTFNRQQRLQGSLDIPLDDTGIHQATSLVARLQGIPIDHLVTSPLLRAQQTAVPLAAARRLVPKVDVRFREQSFGHIEGMSADEIRRAYPAYFARDFRRAWVESPEGGETLSDVFMRVHAALTDLRLAHQGQTVAVMSHGFVSRVVSCLHSGQIDGFFAWHLDNASFMNLDFGGGIHLPTDLFAI